MRMEGPIVRHASRRGRDMTPEAQRPPLISCIIITMNRRHDLGDVLASIERQTCRDREILVVDNASTDGTPEFVAEHFPAVTIIRSPENLGVSGGRNLGILRSRGAYIVNMDDDAEFADTQALARVVEKFTKDPQLAVLSFRIEHKTTRRMHFREFPGRDMSRRAEAFATSYFLGGASALRRETLEHVGTFEEAYIYGPEEVELGYRIIEAGYGIQYAPDIVVLHKASPDNRPSGQWYHFNLRGRFILTVKNLPWIIAIPHLLIWNAYIFTKAVTSGNLRHFWTGFLAGCRVAPAMLKKRRPLRWSTILRLRKLYGRVWY